MKVRTRFAPSPTGYLHIGGVRTALFNWLFARRHGGQFVLRIDDTDMRRNVEQALAPILRGLRWLGIDWDEGPEVDGPFAPYYQSQRRDRYRAAVDRLLATGAAYRDYAMAEELQAERQAAQAAGRPFVYSRRFLAATPADQGRFEAAGRQGVVRLMMPRDGTLVLSDLVRGEVRFAWNQEQDHVIQRADGSCLYHLATVVDDHELEISHVIRAEEHLSNTPRQVFIAQSLGYASPEYAHLPLVAEPGSRHKLSKRKLSKYLKHRDFAAVTRHGQQVAKRLGLATTAETFNPVLVDFYETVGYLPDAVVNYLLLLGWSLDDKTEEFTREEMIAQFTLARVRRAPASFDPAKLDAFQQRFMQRLPIAKKVELVRPFLRRAGLVPNADDTRNPTERAGTSGPQERIGGQESPPSASRAPSADTVSRDASPVSGPATARIRAVLEAAGDRIVLAGDILDSADLFLPDDQLPYDPKPLAKRLGNAPESARLLAKFRQVLAAVTPFTAAEIEATLRTFVAGEDIKIGQIIHALRVATTGKAVGFGMFETLSILGRDSSLARIDRALTLIGDSWQTEAGGPH